MSELVSKTSPSHNEKHRTCVYVLISPHPYGGCRDAGKHVLLDMLREHNDFTLKPHIVWMVERAFDSVVRQAIQKLMPGVSAGNNAGRRGSYVFYHILSYCRYPELLSYRELKSVF